MDQHPSLRLEDTLQHRVRMAVMALLHDTPRMTFSAIHQALGTNEGSLSRHLSVLEEAGFVEIEKTFEGKRPRTWVSLTQGGREALAMQLRALRELMRRFEKQTDERAALAAMFALGSLSGETSDDEEVERMPGYGNLIVDTTSLPVGFELDYVHSGPINRFGEGPPHEVPGGFDPAHYRKVQEDERKRQIELGLVGGYIRNFVMPVFAHAQPGVMINLHEYGTEEAARRSLEPDRPLDLPDFVDVDVPGVAPVFAKAGVRHQSSDHPRFGGEWDTGSAAVGFLVGRLACVVSGAGDLGQEMVDLVVTVAQEQYRRLADASLPAVG